MTMAKNAVTANDDTATINCISCGCTKRNLLAVMWGQGCDLAPANLSLCYNTTSAQGQYG